jgi:hypothetical protein
MLSLAPKYRRTNEEQEAKKDESKMFFDVITIMVAADGAVVSS